MIPRFDLTCDQLLEYKKYNHDLPSELVMFLTQLDSKKNNKNNKNNNNNHNNNTRTTKPSWGSNKSEDSDTKLYEQFTIILNKISDSNLEQSSNELISLNIKTCDHLAKLVDIIFAKAVSEFKYVNTYSKLIKLLSPCCVENENAKKTTVKELLFCKCEKAFTESISYDKSVENAQHEKFYKYKNDIHGCMLLVSALYNNELLIDKIIYSCFNLLFNQIGQNKAYTTDCICTLMRLVGKRFCYRMPNESQLCFKKIDEIQNQPVISKKEKFAIMDLVDLKNKEKWF